MQKAKVVSTLKYTRISPKKVAPVLNLVRGKAALEAARILKFDTTKGARLALKALKTAMADAKKHLEKQMASATSLDDLRSMLSN